MRERRQQVALSAVLAATVVALGCGGTDTAGRKPAEAPPGEETAATSASRNACDLITTEEMAEFAGEPVKARPGKGGRGYSKCEYWGTRNEVPYLSVTAYWTGGREAWQTYRAGMGLAADMVKAAEGVELDSITKPGPVPGLGDAAVYSELVPAAVLRGDQFLELHLFYLPDAKRKFRPLVERMLARL
ncbi:MAG: hypothetical protein ACREM9_02220 [Gemmatimonadales bacterium]